MYYHPLSRWQFRQLCFLPFVRSPVNDKKISHARLVHEPCKLPPDHEKNVYASIRQLCSTKPPRISHLLLLHFAEWSKDASYLHYGNHLAPLFLIDDISRRVLRSDNSIILLPPHTHTHTSRITSPSFTTGAGCLPPPPSALLSGPPPKRTIFFPLGRQKNERQVPEELRLGPTAGCRRIKANNKLVTAVANK